VGRHEAEVAGRAELRAIGLLGVGAAVTVMERRRAAGGVESTGRPGRRRAKPGRRGSRRRAIVHTRWRAAAEWRRRRTERRPAAASTTVDLRAREMGSMLESFFLGVFDEGGHAVEVVRGEFGGGDVEEGGDDLRRGVAEERIEKMTQGGVFGLGGG